MTTNTYIVGQGEGFDSFERESIVRRLDHLLGLVENLELIKQRPDDFDSNISYTFGSALDPEEHPSATDDHRVVTVEKRTYTGGRPTRLNLTYFSQETRLELRLSRPVLDHEWTEASTAMLAQEVAYWRSLFDHIIPPNNSPIRSEMDRELAKGLTATFALLYAQGYNHDDCVDGTFDFFFAHPHGRSSVVFRTPDQFNDGAEPAPCFNDAGSDFLASIFPAVQRLKYDRTASDIYLTLQPYDMLEEFMDLPFDNPIEMMRIIGSLPADKIDGIVLPPNLSV